MQTRQGLAVLGVFLVFGGSFSNAAERLLCAFDSPGDLRQWEFGSGTSSIAPLPGKPDTQALHLVFDPAGQYQPGYMTWNRVQGDWNGFDVLVLDVFNPADQPLSGYVLVADQAWADKGRTYWNRHNASTTFPPGLSTWSIPVSGLFRGEAGSRNNDIPRNIDPDHIIRLDFGFGRKGQGGEVYLARLRLFKAERVPGIQAFDFGPPQQPVMPGWTPVSHASAFDAEQGFGWGPEGGQPWDGAARDTTFGTALTQDFCESRGYSFRVAVQPGRYAVLFVLENCGYWGGEQAKFRRRSLAVNGKVVWQEERPDGPAHHLWRFEDVDPVGADIWDTYIIPEICRPVAVTVETARPELVFRFDADQVWACKLAALALHPVADAAAADWLAGQLEAVAGEFRGRAACLDAPAKAYDPPRAWQPLGMVAWPLTIEDAITPASLPTDVPPAPGELRLACAAMVRGEYEPASLAIRPLRDLGPCSLALTGDLGEGLTAALDLVHCNTSRGFNSLAYRIRPHTLRPGAAVDLKAHVTRQLVVTFHTRPETPPGTRRPHLQLRNAAGAVLLDVPIEVTVHPVVLDRDTPFLMGFFGLMPPGELGPERQWAAFEETLLLLRSHGMNAVSGGPNWRLKGWENGRPVLDLGEADRFFALLRKHGFEHPINGYGGCRFLGLHDGYRKGAATSRVEKESGLPYEEAFLRAWQAINEHASRQHWPTVFYAMCDETRVRSVAEAELEFMKTMAEISRRWPDRVRASGSYSVTFERSPRDEDDLLHWHQEFFRVLDISSLNNHDASVLEEARRLGREIHIYNQGRDRYSFGLYQWAEQAKGVRARWQWHLNILHGYQFFDLDGREPDTAMLCYGREGIYPTLDFERCREGAEDFHLLHTLSQRLEAARRQPERAAAVRQGQALLQRLESSVGVNRRTPPAGYDPMALKEELVRACAALAEDR